MSPYFDIKIKDRSITWMCYLFYGTLWNHSLYSTLYVPIMCLVRLHNKPPRAGFQRKLKRLNIICVSFVACIQLHIWRTNYKTYPNICTVLAHWHLFVNFLFVLDHCRHFALLVHPKQLMSADTETCRHGQLFSHYNYISSIIIAHGQHSRTLKEVDLFLHYIQSNIVTKWSLTMPLHEGI